MKISLCRLTATVEPFFPIPPDCITLKKLDNDQAPQTIVIKDIVFHSSISPIIYVLHKIILSMWADLNLKAIYNCHAARGNIANLI